MPTAASRRSFWSSSAAAAAVCALAAGCGGSSDAGNRRDAVNAYFTAVNQAEAPVRNDGTAIAGALHAFSLVKISPAEITALQKAEGDFTNALAAVQALAVPAPAQTLHAHLTALLAR